MLTVRKVAKMLGVTTYTVRHWVRTGKIKAVKIPPTEKSQWFFDEAEIQRLMRGSKSDEQAQEN